MDQVVKITLLCSLFCLVTGTGRAPELVPKFIRNAIAKHKARKEEKITVANLNKLITDAKRASNQFDEYLAKYITNSFLKKTFKAWLANIKNRMKANQKAVEQNIAAIINRSEIEQLEKETNKIQYRHLFLQMHYGTIGKSLNQGLIAREKEIVDAFRELDFYANRINQLNLTAEIDIILRKMNKEDFDKLEEYSNFSKKADNTYESLRGRIFEKMIWFKSAWFHKLVLGLLSHIDEMFFTRKRKGKLFRRKRDVKFTDKELVRRLFRQLITYPNYKKKDPAIRKTIRNIVRLYVPRYLVKKHVSKFLTTVLNSFLNRTYLDVNFREIERVTSNYAQLFDQFVRNLELYFSPEEDRLARWHEEGIRMVRQQQRMTQEQEWLKYTQALQKQWRAQETPLQQAPPSPPQPLTPQPIPQPVYPQPPVLKDTKTEYEI